MANVIFGNHSALRVPKLEKDRIRKFYCDVLGGKLMRSFEDKDDICIGGNFYISFLYGAGNGGGADKGVNYASAECLSEPDFLKAIFLELKTDHVEEMKSRIVEFEVKVLEVPDAHLYFQAPGGQVFRLVGLNKDLSNYEGH